MPKRERVRANNGGVKRSQQGAIARGKALMALLQSKKTVPSDIAAACASQGGLAALSRPEWGIHPLSLNALKAGAIVLGNANTTGWIVLDHLRKEVKKHGRLVIHSDKKPKPPKATAKAQLVHELKVRCDQKDRARAVILRAYTDLLSIAKVAGNRDSDIRERVGRHLATFGQLGIRQLAESEK